MFSFSSYTVSSVALSLSLLISGNHYCILLPNGVPFDTNFLPFSVFSLKAGATELLLGRTNV